MTNVDAWVVLAPAAIAALAALMGTWLGGRSASRGDDRRWRREQRRDASLNLSAAVSDMCTGIGRVAAARLVGDALGADAEITDLNAAVGVYNEALPAVILFGSREVLDVLEEIEGALHDVKEAMADANVSGSRWERVIEGLDDTRTALLNACRSDLGFPRRNSRIRIALLGAQIWPRSG